MPPTLLDTLVLVLCLVFPALILGSISAPGQLFTHVDEVFVQTLAWPPTTTIDLQVRTGFSAALVSLFTFLGIVVV
jgi:hypothetical protein